MSVGIMQVQSLYPFTDAESIREACVLLKPSILKMVRQGREDYSEDLFGNDFEGYFEEHIEQILKVYNGKKLYAAEVKNLFLNICNWEKEKRPVFG